MLNKKILFVIVLLVIILILIVFLIVNLGRGQLDDKEKISSVSSPTFFPTATTIPINTATVGSLQLINLEGKRSFSINEPITFQLLADSAGEEIVGFDVLLAYDSSAFEFIKATSLLPDFKVYAYPKKDYLVLTVVKSLQSSAKSVFQKTPVLTLNFTAKTAGRFTFVLREQVGKETTNLINDKTRKLLPQLNQLAIEIY